MLLMYTQEFAFEDDQRRYVPEPEVMGFVSNHTEHEAGVEGGGGGGAQENDCCVAGLQAPPFCACTHHEYEVLGVMERVIPEYAVS